MLLSSRRIAAVEQRYVRWMRAKHARAALSCA